MALSINSNIASLNAQRNLSKSQSALATSLQRLSSGLRINSAKDDAAGLAISERFTAQIRGLNQASRNANDAISLSQTAEGALSEYGNILQRIRELALQSANSTNSSSDRTALNSEASQLLSELSRVSATTQFNGQNIIDGTFTGAQFQVGANANQIITVNIGNASTDALGAYQVGSSASAVTTANLAGGDLLINSVDVGSTTSSSAEAKTAAINSVKSTTGVTATASTSYTSTITLSRNQTLQSGDFVLNGVNVGAVAGNNNIATQGASLAAAVNNVTSSTGITATSDLSTGALTLSSATGKDINITTTNSDAGAARLENAAGIEISTGQTKGTYDYTFGGVAGVNDIGLNGGDTAALAGDTIVVGGVTYEFQITATAVTGSGNTKITIGGTTTVTTTNAAAAISSGSANVTASSTSNTKIRITSSVLSSTVTHTDATISGGTATSTYSTTGTGLAVGDTLTVGGVSYEFTFSGGTATTGNTQVDLGASATIQATSLFTAITGRYTAVATNVVATNSNATRVLLTAENYGDTGDADVLDSTLPTAGITGAQGTNGANGTYTSGGNKNAGTIELSSSTTFIITGNNAAKAGLGSATATQQTINNVNISTVAGANAAIARLDGALDQVNSIRADLGAVANRFESTVTSNTSTAENLTAARSRILDADYAAETAKLTRAQILQQAGVAILSQANSLPQLALSLLQ